MSSNIPQPKSRLVQPGSASSGLRKPASSSSLRTSTTTRPTASSSRTGTGVPSTPSTPRFTSSTTTRPTLRNATSHSSLTPSTNPVPRVKSPQRPTFRSTASNGSTTSNSSTRTTRPPALKSPTKTPAKPVPSELDELSSPGPKAALSLKDIIAQKRADAKKALKEQQRNRPNSALAGSAGDSAIGDGDLLPEDNDWNGGRGALSQQEEDDLLGRRSVKESIERARETGSLNLTSRSLSYLPTSLFSIHLSVDPELLPGQTASSQEESTPHRQLAYYEAVDLTSLKARDNSITHLQPEISLFGSLKVLDFAKNNLSALPDSIGELACLVHLDLSENKFERFPENAVTYLAALSWLDMSRNQLKILKFVGGMTDAGPTPPSPGFGSDSFFASSSSRNGRGGGMSQPQVLSSLKTFNVADNQLTAASIDTSGIGGSGAFPPQSLVKLDLSGNPLGAASALVAVLSSAAPALKELSMKKCELEQGSFGVSPGTEDDASFTRKSRAKSGPFQNLHVLDISENGWLKEHEVKEYFKGVVERGAVIGAPNESIDVPPGAVEVRLGMRDTREKWEVEAELNGQRPRTSNSNSNATTGGTDGLDEDIAGLAIGERESGAPRPVMGGGRKRQDRPKSVQKEQWEVDVDEGLHTEAGRLRKRMEEERKAAEAEEAKRKEKEQAVAAAVAAASASKAESSQAAKGTLEKYYEASSHTLALPSSKRKPAHNRHVSLTFSRSAAAASGSGGGAGDPNVPTETLPMTIIVTQPWSSTLRALHMSNRRADSVFSLPASPASNGIVRLERVEEVLLDGCALGDLVRVRRGSGDAGGAGEGTDEPIFELLGGMFPAMTTLDLSENGLTKVPGLVKLFFSNANEEGDGRKGGLKVLRLKGNAIADVEGLVEVAERFGRGDSEGWRGEEIDIRDNQIPKLPPVLGLLQLDVLLVAGNVFRVPPRTVWLREGTQGLLRWLRESAVLG